MENKPKGNDVIDVEAKIVADDHSLPVAVKVGPIDVTANVAVFDPIKASMAELTRIIITTPYDIGTAAGKAVARDLRSRCVKLRTGADELYKERNTPLLELQRKMRDIVKEIGAGIKPHEKKLDEAIKEEDRIREEERQRKVAIEEARVRDLRAKITAIASLPTQAARLDGEGIAALITGLGLNIFDEANFGEFAEEAQALAAEVGKQLDETLVAIRGRERHAAELTAESARLELERVRQAREAGLRNQIIAIQSYPLGALGLNSIEIQALLDGLQGPTLEVFGDMLDEAKTAFLASEQKIQGILEGAKVVEQAAAASEAARKAELEQRQREDDAAAQRRRDADAASAHQAKLLKDQQDAFEAERAEALRSQQVESERLAADRAQLEQDQRDLLAASAPPVEPTATPPKDSAEILSAAPAPGVVAAPAAATQRPTDANIVKAVAYHFDVGDETALAWIESFDAQTARDGLAMTLEEISA